MKFSVLVTLVILMSSGCATVFKGSSQNVSFTSEPDGVEIIIDGSSFGQTPLSVKLKKNKYSSILAKKPGFRSQTKALDKSYDAVALLNITWDLSTTDMISGAAYEYEPNSYHFTMAREDAPAPAEAPAKK